MEPDQLISQATAILRAGGLVVFPTETVYGVGADATNSAAVRRIFQAKGRPGTNPLIVHIASVAIARRYSAAWPEVADELARRFWPGPLTLVVPKAPSIVPEATAGLDSVGLRCPDHPLALQLLRAFDGAVAAPSANRSERLSPTTADHVRQELGDAVDLVLDGGPCRVGIESTVLALTQRRPKILRPGAITREQIEAVIGTVEDTDGRIQGSKPAESPGQQIVHYAPTTSAYRFQFRETARVMEWLDAHRNESAALVVIGGEGRFSDLSARPAPVHIERMPPTPDEYARGLYAALRRIDALRFAAILIELPPPEARWTAVRDRLVRATRPL